MLTYILFVASLMTLTCLIDHMLRFVPLAAAGQGKAGRGGGGPDNRQRWGGKGASPLASRETAFGSLSSDGRSTLRPILDGISETSMASLSPIPGQHVTRYLEWTDAHAEFGMEEEQSGRPVQSSLEFDKFRRSDTSSPHLIPIEVDRRAGSLRKRAARGPAAAALAANTYRQRIASTLKLDVSSLPLDLPQSSSCSPPQSYALPCAASTAPSSFIPWSQDVLICL